MIKLLWIWPSGRRSDNTPRPCGAAITASVPGGNDPCVSGMEDDTRAGGAAGTSPKSRRGSRRGVQSERRQILRAFHGGLKDIRSGVEPLVLDSLGELRIRKPRRG